jgi:hypothetical protein
MTAVFAAPGGHAAAVAVNAFATERAPEWFDIPVAERCRPDAPRP